MNIYYYLYYKLSRVLNRKGKNEMGVFSAQSFLIYINIIIIYIKIFHVTKENFNSGYKTILIIIGAILFITNSFLFLNKKRCKRIMNRYKNESLKSKRIGNVLVILYIVLTLASIFVA